MSMFNFSSYSDLRKNKWNKITLSAREHFIAHWLLWKAYPSSNLIFAFKSMILWHGNHKRYSKINSKVYEKLKIESSIKIKELNHQRYIQKVLKLNNVNSINELKVLIETDIEEFNTLKSITEKFKINRVFAKRLFPILDDKTYHLKSRKIQITDTVEYKLKLSNALKGKRHSIESKKKMSISSKGKNKSKTCWLKYVFVKDIDNKIVGKIEIHDTRYNVELFPLTRKEINKLNSDKAKIINKNKSWYYNKLTNKEIWCFPDESPVGFVSGRKPNLKFAKGGKKSKGKIWISNPETNQTKMILPLTTIPEGWVKGRIR